MRAMLVIVALLAVLALREAGAVIWPKPVSMQGGATVPIDFDSFRFNLSGAAMDSQVLQNATKRYSGLLFYRGPPLAKPSSAALTTISIKIATAARQSISSNESYSIAPTGSDLQVEAMTATGALRALETIAQLSSYDYSANCYTVQLATIVDFPNYQYRGLMIDSARHFLSVPLILSIIDTMAYQKLNVLHWHMTDDQAFPWNVTANPAMATGAYQPIVNHVYQRSDLKAVSQYAESRGVLVQLELDGPAHGMAWNVGLPGAILTPSGCSPLMDPTNEALYTLYDQMFAEIAELFPTMQYVHIGTDEVEDNAWQNTPHVVQWAAEKNLSVTGWATPDCVFCYFNQQRAELAAKHGLSVVVWEDARRCGLPNATSTRPAIVDVWDASDGGTVVDSTNFDMLTIVSSNCEFLNSNMSEWKHNWMCDPRGFSGLSAAAKKIIIGGHASRWGESTDDSDWYENSFPAALGTSEGLWSSPDYLQPANLPDASGRIQQFRCYLSRRGIPIQPFVIGPCPEEYSFEYVTPEGRQW